MRTNNDKDVTMDQLHRPQRAERKDPFPQIPFAIEEEAVPSIRPVEIFLWGIVFVFAVTVIVIV